MSQGKDLAAAIRSFDHLSATERATFALLRASACVAAVAQSYGFGLPGDTGEETRPFLSLGQVATPAPLHIEESANKICCALLGAELRNRDIVEIQLEPATRWIQIWIEGLPQEIQGCLVLSGAVVRFPLTTQTRLRWPERPCPALATYARSFSQLRQVQQRKREKP